MKQPIRGVWRGVETKFFVTTCRLPPPDEIIDAISSDKADRGLMEMDHPLKGRMRTAGCYLYFGYYKWEESAQPVFIYAGKASHLGKRLWTHWTTKGHIAKFLDAYLSSRENDIQVSLSDGTTKRIELEPFIRVALWFRQDKRERTLLEHGLIYGYQPCMNVG